MVLCVISGKSHSKENRIWVGPELFCGMLFGKHSRNFPEESVSYEIRRDNLIELSLNKPNYPTYYNIYATFTTIET